MNNTEITSKYEIVNTIIFCIATIMLTLAGLAQNYMLPRILFYISASCYAIVFAMYVTRILNRRRHKN